MIARRPVCTDAVALVPLDLKVVNTPHPSAWHARVVVGITVSNASEDVGRSIESALTQDFPTHEKCVIVLLDRAGRGAVEGLSQPYAEHPQVVVLSARCGSASRARNAILDFVDQAFIHTNWVARLDADDTFSTVSSLRAACALGDATNAVFVLGGNRLTSNGVLIEKTNSASPRLREMGYLLHLLQRMSDGTAENELPSCNLLLRTHTGIRYPEFNSAEDHWLVAHLLLCDAARGAILECPFFVDYSLSGNASEVNRQQGRYLKSRRKLYDAMKLRAKAITAGAHILGAGNEGIVTEENGLVVKRFYIDAMDEKCAEMLRGIISTGSPFLPAANIAREGERFILRYNHFKTEAVQSFLPEEVNAFLLACLQYQYVCLNIKAENFRRTPSGELVMIDLGRDVVPFEVRLFLDSAARLFAQCQLQWPPPVLRRRRCGIREEDALMALPGFAEYFKTVMKHFAHQEWGVSNFFPVENKRAKDVSLLIKCCAMDEATLAEQVRHIVTQLESPQRFARRILLVDSYQGPFLREHSKGDLNRLIRIAKILKRQGWLDDVWLAPNDPSKTRDTLERWFGIATEATHTTNNVPLFSQLWAFERIDTRYLLQCDVDILCGRRDWTHDYLTEMVEALQAPDVLSVAFNIPKPANSGFQPFEAPPGAYVPEVRCGLLDLNKLATLRPLPNRLRLGKCELSWYRSLEKKQQERGLKTLRGGDPRTFYIHPQNQLKEQLSNLDRIRELVGQGLVPENQFYHWDLVEEALQWTYPSRCEDIIFLIKGRNTPSWKIERCFRSLEIQQDKNFGVILIDDHSTEQDTMLQLQISQQHIQQGVTLIRNDRRMGHLANLEFAVREICGNPDSLIVILDLDDALLTRNAVCDLRSAYDLGHDVILAAPFRPEKPLKSYTPDFSKPRTLDGGEVWIHLRAFRKTLFEQIPQKYLQLKGKWIPECTDYALMIPMVELARMPVFLPFYLYFHERSGPSRPIDRMRKDSLIEQILQNAT